MDFMTAYYLGQKGSYLEKIYFAIRRKNNPYLATFVGDPEWKRFGYTCGHNPWLEARLCHDIHVFSFDERFEIVEWNRDSLTQG